MQFCTKVELSLSAKGLKNKDILSKSDPICVIEIRESRVGKYLKIGSTETIQNNLNPEWTKTFSVNYFFEKQQFLRFVVYDYDGPNKLEKIGECETTMGRICGSVHKSLSLDLMESNKVCGKLTVRSEDVKMESLGGEDPLSKLGDLKSEEEKLEKLQTLNRDSFMEMQTFVSFKIVGHKLKKMDLFGKSDPYYCIYRKRSDQSWQKVMQSEMIKKTLNPSWKAQKMLYSSFCGSDSTTMLRIEVYDWDKNSSDDLIGKFELSVTDIEEDPNGHRILRVEGKKAKDNRGEIYFDRFGIMKEERHNEQRIKEWREEVKNMESTIRRKEEERRKIEIEMVKQKKLVEERMEFLRLIPSTEINLIVAIDCTGSNGSISSSSSLHYLNRNGGNDYQRALKQVGSIIMDYDNDKRIPFFGYCGDVHGGTKLIFPMNDNYDDAEVDGVEGMLNCYNSRMKSMSLGGFTKLNGVFHRVNNDIKEEMKSETGNRYFILLILSDGGFEDMDLCIKELVIGSELPLSVVIVGVGKANFNSMNVLDGDDGLLHSNILNKKAKRDIVQFVAFRDVENDAEKLSEETLKEIPGQFVGYYKGNQ